MSDITWRNDTATEASGPGFRSGSQNPNWTGGKIERTCLFCGNVFYVRRSSEKSGRGKFCSMLCKRMNSSVEKKCEACGAEFWIKKSKDHDGNGRYCSIKCRSEGWKLRGIGRGEKHSRYIDGSSRTKEYDCRKSHRRRVQKANGGGDYTLQEWTDLCAKYNNKCLACGRDDVQLTVDHVIPISIGGANSIDNLQPLCRSCNAKKRVQVIDYR